MRLIEAKPNVRQVQKQWERQYQRSSQDYGAHSGKLDQLEALPDNATIQQIEAVIGNDFWTRPMCAVCHERVLRFVEFRDTDDDGICESCATQAAALFGVRSTGLRDEFAKAALTGMIASAPVVDRTTVNKKIWAGVAYEFADAMLEARKR